MGQLSILSGIMASFYVCRFIMELQSETAQRRPYAQGNGSSAQVAAALAWLLLKLLVVACGFYGARSRSSASTMLFATGSLCFAVKGIVSFIWLAVRVLGLHGDCNAAQEFWAKRGCKALQAGQNKGQILS